MSTSSLQDTEEEGRYKNKGAYIVLEPPHFDSPVFHSFEAVTPRPQVQILLTSTRLYSRWQSYSIRFIIFAISLESCYFRIKM